MFLKTDMQITAVFLLFFFLLCVILKKSLNWDFKKVPSSSIFIKIIVIFLNVQIAKFHRFWIVFLNPTFVHKL